MATLLAIRTDLRSRLDESSARFWSNTELNTWINEGLRDVSRRSEVLLKYDVGTAVVAGTAKYTLPTDVIRLHRVEFVPTGSTSIYPLEASTYQQMDSVWGVQQSVQRSYPSYYVLWGVAGAIGMTIQLYPVPSQAGLLYLYYYRLPATLSSDSDVAEIPAGWEDLVTQYAEYVAMRKDRDPRWQDSKALYEEALINLINVTRQLHDQARSVTVGTMSVPGWLYEFDW